MYKLYIPLPYLQYLSHIFSAKRIAPVNEVVKNHLQKNWQNVLKMSEHQQIKWNMKTQLA